MSYAQISAIIGGDGIVVENDGNQLLIFWINEAGDSSSGVMALFEDQVAVKIEQWGLE